MSPQNTSPSPFVNYKCLAQVRLKLGKTRAGFGLIPSPRGLEDVYCHTLRLKIKGCERRFMDFILFE